MEIGNLYDQFRTRLAVHVPSACSEISVMLPARFSGELAFYRLVNWTYVLIQEAARIPIEYLINLPPLEADASFRREIKYLRTFVSHNLDVTTRRDRKMYAFVSRWFKESCGRGTPSSQRNFTACCARLAGEVDEVLTGAITACDLLDDPEDGPRLVAGLEERIDSFWQAHRFDPIVAKCAARFGDFGLDLVEFRSRHLEGWRRVLAVTETSQRGTMLEQKIEADLLQIFRGTLPVEVRRELEKIAESRESVVTGLLILSDASRVNSLTVPEIIQCISKNNIC